MRDTSNSGGEGRSGPRRGMRVVGHGRVRRLFQPRLQALESRRLLATFTVSSTGDNGSLGTLRTVIAQATASSDPSNTIVFSPSVFDAPQTITLAQGALALSSGTIVIVGPGAGLLTIAGEQSGSVFQVAQGVTATISGLTISGGSATDGGGVDSLGNTTLSGCAISGNTATYGGGVYGGGTITLSGCTISGNTATYGGGVYGGGSVTLSNCTISGNSSTKCGAGLYVYGSVALSDCTISGNSSSLYGGGVASYGKGTISGCTISGNSALDYGGGLCLTDGTMTLSGCTISGNSAALGGGLFNFKRASATLFDCTIAGDTAAYGGGLFNYGAVSLTACTVSGNSATSTAGGIYNFYVETTTGSVTLTDTIVAGNQSLQGRSSDIGGNAASVVTGTYNLIGTGGSGGIKSGSSGNIVLTSLATLDLSPLGDYGGPTETMALLPGSQAIGAGTAITGVTTDERGFALDSPVDIGAYQATTVALVVSVATDGVGAPSGELDLRGAVDLADIRSGSSTISFAATTFATPQTITLEDGPLPFTGTSGTISLTAPAAGLTLNGGPGQVVQVGAGAVATISGLAIAGGSATIGGGVYNAGTLTLVDCTISGSTAGTGGALYNRGTATLEECTLAANSATEGGGLANVGVLTLAECTVSGNTAAKGGGIYELTSGSGSATLTDTIVAGNLAPGGAASDIGGTDASAVAGSYDLIGPGGSGGIAGGVGGDIVLASLAGLGLAPLGEYGGSTPTMALLPGSPALGAGSNSLIPSGITEDQRGLPRIVGGTVDIGACESQGFTLTPVAGSTPQSALVGQPFAASLAITVTAIDPAEPVAGGLVTFTVVPSGGASATLSAVTAVIGAGGTAFVTAVAGPTTGSYTVTATATGAPASASFSLTDGIQPAFSGLSAPTITFGTGQVTCSGTIAAGEQVPTGESVSVTLDGMTQPAVIAANGSFSTTFSGLGGLGVTGSPYPIEYAYAGDAIFTAISQATELTITPAAPTVAVTDAGGAFDGSAYSATATVQGIGGSAAATLEDVGLTISYFAGTTTSGTPMAAAPTDAGTYTALATFPGSADYLAARAQLTFTIARATPTLTVTDPGGTYNGSSFPASASVAGIGGSAGASLEGVTPSLTYYAGSTVSGSPLGSVPANAGTYTALASFPGSTDYAALTATTTFTIAWAEPTVSLSDAGGSFDGSPFPASATVAGLDGIAGSSLEGTGLTIAYYGGTTASGSPMAVPPTAAGTYTALAAFPGSADYGAATAEVTFTITAATPSVAVSDAGGTFDGSAFAAIASVAGLDGAAGSTLEGVGLALSYYAGLTVSGSPLGTAPTAAGTYTVLATFPGSTDYVPRTAQATFTIAQAVPTVVVSDAGGAYSGSGFPATATVAGTNGVPGLALEGVSVSLAYYAGDSAGGTMLAGIPTVVGTYTVLATFPGSADYLGGTAQATFSISRAVATVVVSDAGGSYNGSAFTADATVSGPGSGPGSELEGVGISITYYTGTVASGSPLSQPPTQPGVYTVVAAFPGSTDYTAATAQATFTISLATPTLVLTDAGGTYDGSPFPAAVTIAGASGSPAQSLEGVSPAISYDAGTGSNESPLSGLPTTAGIYTALASFPGSADYRSVTTLVTFTIAQAAPTVAVTDAGGTYDDLAFPASASVAGISGAAGSTLEGFGLTLSYYAGTAATGSPMPEPPTQAGVYTVLAAFPGSTDYTAATSQATFTVSQATPTVSVSDASGTYDGLAFPASATVAGIGGTAGTSLEGVGLVIAYYAGSAASGTPLGGPPTEAGAYSALADFPGSTDYRAVAAEVTFTITQAAPTVTPFDAGGTYTGSPFPATATVTGVNGLPALELEGVSAALTYFAGSSASGSPLAGAPSNVGTYTALAVYPGSTDYLAATAQVTFTVARAAPTVTVTDSGGTYNGSAFPALAAIEGIDGPTGSSLEGVSVALSYYAGMAATGSPLLEPPTEAGVYTVLASFPGSTDYTAATAQATFTITRATPTLNIADPGGTYDGSSFAASVTVTGATGPPAPELEGTSPSLTYYAGTEASGSPLSMPPSDAGTYTVLASFAGSADYQSTTAEATFTIARATPVLSIQDAGGTYDGSAFPAVESVAGVDGGPGSELEGVELALTYYAGATADGTPEPGPPSDAGTYTAVATFAGSADYLAATVQVTFTITPASPTVTVTDMGGTYDGSAVPAVASIAGINGSAGTTLESVGLILTYYPGPTASGSPEGGPPSTAGQYTVVASFPGSVDYAAATARATFTILQAVPTVTATDAGGTFDGFAFPAAASVAGIDGTAKTTLEGVGLTITYYAGTMVSGSPIEGQPDAAGTYTALASFAGSIDYAPQSARVTFTIAQATPTVAVTDASGAFDGSSFAASATVTGIGGAAGTLLEGVGLSLSYYAGSSASGLPLAAAPSNVGTYTVLASFAGSADYLPATAEATFTIAQAMPTLTVNAPGGTYDGSAFPAAATVTGTNGGSGPMLEGVGLDVSYYAGDDATGSPLPAPPVDAGTYSVLASFSGSADYLSATAETTFTIAQATPTVVVSDVGGTYDGSGFAAVTTIAGIDGQAAMALEGVGLALTYYAGATASGSPLGEPPSSAGTYTVVSQFPGSIDYAPRVAQATFTIAQATPTVAVTDAGGTYDGSPLPATASVSGINGLAASALEGVGLAISYYAGDAATGIPLDTAPSAAGTYTALATFPGSADYLPATARTTFTIAQATPTLTIADLGGTYDGSAFPATAAVSGIDNGEASTLEGVGLALSYYAGDTTTGSPLGAPPTAAGTYTALAVFPGSVDYTSGSAQVTFTITPAAPTVTVTDPGGTFDGSAFPVSVSVAGIGGAAATTLEGIGLSINYYVGTAATGTPLGGAPTSAGTYTAVAAFPGSADYLASTASTTFTITQATPTLTVTDSGGPYDGLEFPADASVAGVNGQAAVALEGVGLALTYYAGRTLSGSPLDEPPSAAGTYTVLATFPGSADYAPQEATTTFTIDRATPTLVISDAGGTYDGSRFVADVEVTGAGGTGGPDLEGVAPVLNYYAGTYDDTSQLAGLTSLAGAPDLAGAYTALATFPGSADYTAAAALVDFHITQAVSPITWNSPAAIVYGTALGPDQLDASSAVMGTFRYTPAAGAVPGAGTQTLSVTFTPLDSADYATETATTTILVQQATPSVTVADTGGIFNGSPFAATAEVAGVGDQAPAGASLEGSAPSLIYYAGTTATGSPLAGPPSAVGTYTVVATFPGSPDYTAASSAPVTFSIGAAGVDVTLSTSNSASVTGQAVTFVATVTPAAGGMAGVPTGTVTFLDGTSALASVPLDASGQATLTLSSLAHGGHTITAIYSGDPTFLGGQSASVAQSVAPDATEIILSPQPAFRRRKLVSLSLTALVAPASPGGGTVTGSLTFFVKKKNLGTVQLEGGQATLSLGSHAVLNKSITVVYQGGDGYQSSTTTSPRLSSRMLSTLARPFFALVQRLPAHVSPRHSRRG